MLAEDQVKKRMRLRTIEEQIRALALDLLTRINEHDAGASQYIPIQ